jgi:hypothetical protein
MRARSIRSFFQLFAHNLERGFYDLERDFWKDVPEL